MVVSFDELKDKMKEVLLRNGFPESKAATCAAIFASNSRDGVHSHGLNRFPTFIKYLESGFIQPDAEPVVINRMGSLEQWDGQLAPGMYTATKAMARAAEMAKANGLGAVAVKNTNHWMRGGTYGWQAADSGCIGICATNAVANMPPWGGKEPTLGNNPLVIAVPREEGHLVLDMAMSQFSYGKMQEYALRNAQLPVPGGYDNEGRLSHDPAAVAGSKRTLPVGYWKGAGLSFMIDILVSVLSDGNSVKKITEQGNEYGVSQFFLCICPPHVDETIIEEIVAYAKSSAPAEKGGTVRYPGEQTILTRQRSERTGIEVNDAIWEQVNQL